MPYAIAAQIAYPDRQCVGFVGDGGFTMLMGEFVTAVKYKLPIKVVIIKNNTLGQIKWEQMVFLGNPEYGCDLQPIDFRGLRAGLRRHAASASKTRRTAARARQALAIQGPVVIEAVVDPHEPPMPPKVTLDQAEKLATALAKGTSEPQGNCADDRFRQSPRIGLTGIDRRAFQAVTILCPSKNLPRLRTLSSQEGVPTRPSKKPRLSMPTRVSGFYRLRRWPLGTP